MYPPVTQFETRWEQIEYWLAARDLRRERKRVEPKPPDAEPVMLRYSCPEQKDALYRLALLEGRPAPTGAHVVAEVGGEIVAAVPLRPGMPLADPFRPTAHLIPLLELRATQFADQPGPGPRRSAWRAILAWAGV